MGKLPAGVNPAIGPDATGAGWVYEYALVDKSHTHSLADLRSLQDWNVRYALETVPGVSEVATMAASLSSTRSSSIRIGCSRSRSRSKP